MKRTRYISDPTGSSGADVSVAKIARLVNEMEEEINSLKRINGTEHVASKLKRILEDIKEELTALKESSPADNIDNAQFIPLLQLEELDSQEPDARGSFGNVSYRRYLGQKVAVKFNNQLRNKKSTFLKEIHTLRTISHDNITSFRGWGETETLTYLVMEHLDENLLTYVRKQRSHENKGLSSRTTWDLSNQIVQAMVYLHSHGIVHADLKPDNILIDPNPIILKPKICDFGRAYRDRMEMTTKPEGHVRIRPPIQEQIKAKTIDDFKKYDVLGFGFVVLFMKTGVLPYSNYNTDDLQHREHVMIHSELEMVGEEYLVRGISLQNLPRFFNGLIKECCGDSSHRPFFPDVQKKHFGKDAKNPFDLMQYGEFFECGFLRNTYIYVAHSLVGKSHDSHGRPIGYQSKDLICEVNPEENHKREKPGEEDLRNKYLEFYRDIQNQIRSKAIDEHSSVALTSLELYRMTDDKKQRVNLRFKDMMYSHHRAMRLVWRSLEVERKNAMVPVLDKVHPIFSTSFGLHVAILTNEGPGKTQKFIFTKRTRKSGRPSPGDYTCGAVRGCSALDFQSSSEEGSKLDECENSKTYLSLVDTAARGLEEELGLALQGEEKEAITLQTIYLKFDNHEWGMCGFVDLTNEKIREENRFSFATLNTTFTSGPKDRYENRQIHGVNFELDTMVEWIRKNHNAMASSAKLVAVKVLQAFFDIPRVANAFEK